MTQGKAAALAAQITVPFTEVNIHTTDGNTTKLPIYQLSIADWRQIKKDLGTDMWATLLSLYSKAEEMSEAEKREASQTLLKEFDYELQLAMYGESLKKWDADITPDQVGHIISYGIETQNELMTGLFFMLQGTSAAEVEEDSKGESGNEQSAEVKESQASAEDEEQAETSSDSVEEALTGEQSKSSSEGGIRSDLET